MLHQRHFRHRRKRGPKEGKTKRGKGSKFRVIADALGLPVTVYTDSARPHEVKLVEAAINEVVTVGHSRRLTRNRAYNSDPLDEALARQEIELIAPHRKNRKQPAMQDGCCLRGIKEDGRLNTFLRGLTNFKRQ